MHNNKFYASGFLFHPPSQQILLQQSDPTGEISLFSGEGDVSEAINDSFRRVIHEKLKIKLSPELIHHIYSYNHHSTNKLHHVFYAEIDVDSQEARNYQKMNARWFTFKVLYKSKLNKDLLQDLIVGQRVINAESRLSL